MMHTYYYTSTHAYNVMHVQQCPRHAHMYAYMHAVIFGDRIVPEVTLLQTRMLGPNMVWTAILFCVMHPIYLM